jgi:hypothetical protein
MGRWRERKKQQRATSMAIFGGPEFGRGILGNRRNQLPAKAGLNSRSRLKTWDNKSSSSSSSASKLPIMSAWRSCPKANASSVSSRNASSLGHHQTDQLSRPDQHGIGPAPNHDAQRRYARLLRQIYNTEADLFPDAESKTLTVCPHHLTQAIHDRALSHFCDRLNATETIFSGTPDLQNRLILISLADQES